MKHRLPSRHRRPGFRSGAIVRGVFGLLVLVTLGSCGALGRKPEPARERADPVASRPAADAEAAREYLAALQELQSGSPARQAEIVQSARLTAENSPTTLNRLRFALMLAVPGHAGSDAVAARRQLSDLLARPELLLPAERALAAVHLADVDERLVLIAENRRLAEDDAQRDKEHGAAAARRLQTELDENARLKRALEDAQKKLDAVMQVERTVTGRGTPPAKP
jgi:hypothetical protein